MTKTVKINFVEQGVTAMDPEETNSGNKGIDASICSEKERKLSWIQNMRIKPLMQIELEAC